MCVVLCGARPSCVRLGSPGLVSPGVVPVAWRGLWWSVVCWAVSVCVPGGACAGVWSSCLVPPSLLVLPGARPRAVVCLLFLLLARSRPRGPWVIRFCVCCSLPPHVVLPGSDPARKGRCPKRWSTIVLRLHRMQGHRSIFRCHVSMRMSSKFYFLLINY